VALCPLCQTTNRNASYDRCSLDARRRGGAASLRRHLGRQAFVCRYERRFRFSSLNADNTQIFTLWEGKWSSGILICSHLNRYVTILNICYHGNMNAILTLYYTKVTKPHGVTTQKMTSGRGFVFLTLIADNLVSLCFLWCLYGHNLNSNLAVKWRHSKTHVVLTGNRL
jgi:hypothetical protein